MPFQMTEGDIVQMRVDAIVNAANSQLRMGGGVCGAVFQAAGPALLQKACDQIGYCPVGGAVITRGYGLYARHVIHAVGPFWRGGGQNEALLLRSAYTAALRLAVDHRIRSIAFPLLSSGIFGYPKDLALSVALSAIGGFLVEQADVSVFLTIPDRTSLCLARKRYSGIRNYIGARYTAQSTSAIGDLESETERGYSAHPDRFSNIAPCAVPSGLEEAAAHLESTFSEAVLHWIDSKGFRKDSDVYRRANVDKSVFSKLRSNKGYAPSKSTALALAVGLGLSIHQTKDLIGRAGFALSPSCLADVIISYFIENGVHDIFEINAALFSFGQPCIGGKG